MSGESQNMCPARRQLGSFSFVTVLDWVLCKCDNEEPGLTMVLAITTISHREGQQPWLCPWHQEESLEKAQSQLDLLGLTAKEVGVHINTSHKYFTCNIPNTSLQLNGEDIENTEDLQYLGSYIAPTGQDIECRKAKGWNEFWKLVRIRFEVSWITPTTGATF